MSKLRALYRNAFVCVVGAICTLVPAPAATAADVSRPSVERVMLKYDAGVYSLVSRQVVAKVIPPSDSLPAGSVSGFFFELRDATGAVRYRKIMANPVRVSFEGPPAGARGLQLPSRTEAVASERTFSILIPLPAPTDVLVLFSSPLEPGARNEPVSEVGRITFAPSVG